MCKRSFQTTFDLNDHLIQNDCSKSVNVEHTYELCQKTYKYKHNLMEHIKTKHSRKEIFKCTKCGKDYEQNYSLNRHLKNCSPQ